ncbi:hypothetical protein ACHP5D_27680 (plasmid) [Escherichia coli]|uniref:hypothetical protein n=1 Tax=Escherichia coli TaxID=562 RepID=UPI00195B7F2D|nr:hypothetical protein [Escherichia coli]WCQ10975.1 hypothetical protein NL410_001345 [Escherichia coli]
MYKLPIISACTFRGNVNLITSDNIPSLYCSIAVFQQLNTQWLLPGTTASNNVSTSRDKFSHVK